MNNSKKNEMLFKAKARLFINGYNNYMLEGLQKETEMSKIVEKRIYTTLHSIDGEPHFFDTEDELASFCDNNGIPMDSFAQAFEYIRNFEGKTDVVRIIDRNGNFKLITAFDEDGYLEYKVGYCEDSDLKKTNVWSYRFYDDRGYAKKLYDAFKERGVVLENDVFGKIVKKYKRIGEMAR